MQGETINMIIDISVQMHGPNSKFCNCMHKGKTALNNNL